MPEVIYEKDKQRLPIKVWGQKEDVGEGVLEQAMNLANLPFAYKWVALMPDYHKGYGMPIGGVLATEKVIIPNAIGVDIGCGMAYVQTSIPAHLLRDVQTANGSLAQLIMGQMMRAIPVGFARHKEIRPEVWGMVGELPQFSGTKANMDLWRELSNHSSAFGTLGGGNHFIELQEDNDGMLGIMIHSGSRSLGAAVHKAYDRTAKEINQRYYSSVPVEWGLSFLHTDTQEGQEYKRWMNLACDFAWANRADMMERTMEIVQESVTKHTGFDDIVFGGRLDVHHNYAAIEHHYGKNVWVHRKGAIRARSGDIGIIPGAMGSYSYLVYGLGNPESFHSASHGAGRVLSRTQAKKEYTVQEVIENSRDFVLGKRNKGDVAEEYRLAYKDIGEVMASQKDLVVITKELRTVAVLKG